MRFYSTFKARFLPTLTSLAIFLATSPLALAAQDEEEEVAKDPVWVMSWASFLFFAAATVMICVVFSRRPDSILTQEDQKKYGQLRADRVTKRRKEERLARLQQAAAHRKK